MKNHKNLHAVILLILFAVVMLLIIYNSNTRNEAFDYSTLKSKPSSIKAWGVKNGYRPVFGNKTLDHHCSQCVLITSSSHLLGSKQGKAIDRAECTIRMNNAPTTGYSVDVGSRTTFRVVAHSALFEIIKKPQEFVHKTPETIFIFWGPENKMKKSLVKVIERFIAGFHNASAFIVNAARMQQFDELFGIETGKDRQASRSWLSTGWFTMVIAIELCDNLHVYGMVPPDYCLRKPRPPKLPYHYYEPKSPDECNTYIHNERSRRGNHHRFITEKRVFARWSWVYNITFSHPDWE